MCYNRLNEYLSKEGYTNNPICSFIFIKKFANGFAIVAVYAYDINLIGSLEELEKNASYLKKDFETKGSLVLKVPYMSATGALLYLA